MTKPAWEEEWNYVEDTTVVSVPLENSVWLAPFAFYDQARLASAAPDMARLLLSNEYAWCQCPGYSPMMPDGHHSDCEWLRVMKKAGIR